MNLSSVIKGAPRYLTIRYGSLNSYVWESLFPRKDRNKILKKFRIESEKKAQLNRMKEIVDEATLLLFIFVTRRVLLEGTDAAKNAVDTLKSLGIKEFYLGKARFSGRNENVMQGEILADKLFASLNKDTKKLLSDARYISQILDGYRNITDHHAK